MVVRACWSIRPKNCIDGHRVTSGPSPTCSIAPVTSPSPLVLRLLPRRFCLRSRLTMQPKPAPAQPNDKRPSTRLRGVTSGYDLDAWPLTLSIEPDETLSSWWARIAARFGVSPAALFREVGFRMGSYTPWRVEQRLARPSSPLSVRTGASNEIRAHAHTAQGRISDLLAGVTQRYHAPTISSKPSTGSRFCPSCLAETGTWSGHWRTPLITMCLRHLVMLVDVCPQCG